MMFELFLLALIIGMAFAQYTEESKKSEVSKKGGWSEDKKSEESKSTEEESDEEEKPEIENYDEVYAVGYDGSLYGASAVYGYADWKQWELDSGDHELYQPAGIAICNGIVDEWGRWAYAYVADYGDAEHPGAVYQYEVVRDPHNPGHYELAKGEVIYGGDEKVGMEDVYGWQNAKKSEESESVVEAVAEAEDFKPPAPTDVTCDPSTGGVFIADNNHGQVVWNGKASAKDNDAWVSEGCGDAVKGVQAAAKADKWVYWSTANQDNEDASGIYRQDVTDGKVNCAEAVESKKWLKKGGDVEKVADYEDGAWGVAIHNDKVLFAQEGEIYSAGEVSKEKDVERWSWGHGEVRKVASANDRGVVYADEKNDGVYVTKGGNKHNKIADVPAAYGVDYYAGKKWEVEEDSASAVVLSVAAFVAAVAAL